MTPQSVSVGCEIFRRTILRENIEDCYLDETSAVKHGGWGIHYARIEGKWRLTYNIIGGPQVVLCLKKGRLREFAFSTRTSEEVLKIVRQRISKSVT